MLLALKHTREKELTRYRNAKPELIEFRIKSCKDKGNR